MIKDGNNFLTAGYSDGDKIFRMLNQNGDLIWEKSYEHPDAYSISKLTDGNFISIGGANSSIYANSLLKFNDRGEEIWNKNHKGFNVLAISNNEFLALTYTGTDSGNLVRFDENGDVIWSKQLDNFRADVNKPSPISIFNYNMEYFICTYINQSNNLNILVLDQHGTEINSHIIDDISGEYTLTSKTIDNGMLIVYSGLFNFGLIKLSNDFLFN